MVSHLPRIASLALVSLALVACGDDEGGGSGGSGNTGVGGGGGLATGGTGGMVVGGMSTGGMATGGDGGTGGMAPFELTSSTITDGGDFPVTHACLAFAGAADSSPPLAWTGGPPGTMSYAVFFRDLTINFEHSAIWDIPSSTASLPEDIAKVAEPSDPAGSKQALAWHGNFNGYAGPCPPAGPPHTYQFELYALSVATLPGVDTNTPLPAIETALEANAIDSVTLTATFTPPPP